MSRKRPVWMKTGKTNRSKLDSATVQRIIGHKSEISQQQTPLFDSKTVSRSREIEITDHLVDLWTVMRKVVKVVAVITILTMIMPGISNGKLAINPYKPAILMLLDAIINFSLTTIGGTGTGEVRVFIGSPLTLVSVYINLSIFVALLVSIPITVKELMGFIKPGLTQKEYEMIRRISRYAFGLFLLGASISYFIILPLMLKILVVSGSSIGGDDLLQLYSLSSILSLILWGTLGGGLLYASPMILVAMVQLEMLEPDSIKERRREIFMGVFILAAIITPDPTMISMTVLALPLIAIIEGVVIWSYKVQLQRIMDVESYYGF